MIQELLESLTVNAKRNAFCIDDKYYSYEELRDLVSGIKAQIESVMGKGDSRNIAIVCTNDIRTYASLLAIWLSGCAYVPLGLHNPVDRNLAILASASAGIIISGVALDDAGYAPYKVIRPVQEIGGGAALISPARVEASDLAYILFTSGSTGAPKGVPISHGNISAFIEAFSSSPFKITREDRCLQMFELTFDVSISSYLPALLSGACVYTVPNDGIKYMHVLRILNQYALTSIQIVPSIIKLAKPLLKRLNFDTVRNCILTGEATSIDLVGLWMPCVPHAVIYNYYGPTESTIYCSFLQYRPESAKTYNGMLAIGKAFDGMELLIVKEDGGRAGLLEKGELWIGGPQVTGGYINNEQKNKDSFIVIREGDMTKRFYRSGDMCYSDEQGDIYYCGRYDNQVKIQGFRVELSEIEFLVRDKFGVNNVVVVEQNAQGATRLILVMENVKAADVQPVLDYLKRKLPEYMIPSDSRIVNEFPLNSSGKTDRKKIRELLYESV